MAIDLSSLTTKEAITAIYVGYFDRAPDPAGLNYWIGRYDEFKDGAADGDAGLTLQQIATSFSTQIESTSIYPFFDTPSVASAQAFITQVYLNLFNRSPDTAGLDYWTNELTSGAQPVGQIIMSIISGATNSAAGNDVDTINNKIEAGCYWVEQAADEGINAVPFTDDPEAVLGAKAALQVVTDDAATVDLSKSNTDAFIAGYGNDDPVTAPKTVAANEDATLSSFVEASDPDGDALTYSVAPSGTTTNGTLQFNADGSFVYTPNADFVGSDSFTYTVSDGNGGSATGTVTIVVNNTNDAPVASNVTAIGEEDQAGGIPVTPVFTDKDIGVNLSEAFTLSVGSNPSNGSVALNAAGDGFIYTPAADFNGQDSFQYIVTDAAGATSIATAEVTVTADDDAPEASDSAAAAAEGGAVVTGAVSATDIDNASIAYAATSFAVDGGQSTSGTPAGLTFNNNGTFSFDPTVAAYNSLDEDDVQTIVVTFTATSGPAGAKLSDTGTLTITVTGTNDAPTASAVTATGSEDGGAITVTAITADVDADDTATFSVSANPANGTVVNNNDGTFTYTPNANFNGTDSFQYTVTDSEGATASATATVTVTAVNDAPVLADTSASGLEDQAISGQLTASDVDGDALSYSVASDVSNGTLVLNANGSYTYTPNSDFNGTDSFTVQVSDGNGGTDTATVTLTIEAVDDVLTTNVDNISGSPNADVVIGTEATLQAGDNIDLGGGDDLVAVTIDNSNGNDPSLFGPDGNSEAGFVLNNVETFQVTAEDAPDGGTSTSTFDMSSSDGVEALTVLNSTANVEFDFANLNADADGDGRSEVELNIVRATNDADVTLDVRDGDLTGNDEVNLNLVDSDSSDNDIDDLTIDSGIGHIDVTVDGNVNVNDLISGNATMTITSGAGDALSIGDNDNNVRLDDDTNAATVPNLDPSSFIPSDVEIEGFNDSLSVSVNDIDATNAAGTTALDFNDSASGAGVAGSGVTFTGGAGAALIKGSNNDDALVGGSANDSLEGENGDDSIDGGAGDDFLMGEDDDDTLIGGEGDDVLLGGSGSDDLDGGVGDDYIDTGDSSDASKEKVSAGTGSDVVWTRGEVLVGRASPTDPVTTVDELDGGTDVAGSADATNNDQLNIVGSSGNEHGLNDVVGFETIDLIGGTFEFTVGANSKFETYNDNEAAAENDMIVIDGTAATTGSAGATVTFDGDVLERGIAVIGSDNNDSLTGGSGDDVLVGDGDSDAGTGGNDSLVGNAGDDTFLFDADELDGADLAISGGADSDTIEIQNRGTVNLGSEVTSIETLDVAESYNELHTETTGQSGEIEDDLTVILNGPSNGGDTFANGTRLTIDGSAMDSDDALTVDHSNGSTNDITAIGGDDEDTFIFSGNFDSDDIVQGGASDDTLVFEGANAVIDANFSLSNSSVECIVLAADFTGSITVGPNAAAMGVTKIDASQVTADITINATNFPQGITIIDGPGNNNITGSAFADTIILDAGNDVVVGNSGDDVVVVDGNGAGADLDENDSINLGSGNDTVQLDVSADAVTATSNLDTNASVENYVIVDGVNAVGGDTNGAISTANIDDSVLEFQNGNVGTLTTINVDASALEDSDDSFTVRLNANQQDADFAFNVTGSGVSDTFEKRNDGVDNNVVFNGNDGDDNFIIDGGDAGSTTEYNGGSGDDTLTVTNGSKITDDGFVEMTSVEVLTSESGELSTVVGETEASDLDDEYSVQLQAGVTYTITMRGDDEGAGTHTDPLLRLFDSTGAQVAFNDDALGFAAGAQIVFTPTTTGQFTVSAEGFSTTFGSYELTFSPAVTADSALCARLGIEADEAGITSIIGHNHDDDVVSDAQFDNDLTVETGAGDDNFDFSASSGTVTFEAAAGDINGNDTLKGGTGTDDEIQLTADNNTADLSGTNNVETVTVIEDGDNDIGITITNSTFTGVASNILRVDASGLDDTVGDDPETGNLGPVVEGSLTLNGGSVTTDRLDVIGGTGNDDITTGSLNDTVSSGNGDDLVNSGAGADAVLLGAGADVANTGAGADNVTGDAGDDTIDGGSGNDTIDGGDDDDLITGGAGTDLLSGGSGEDDFRYVTVSESQGTQRDTITDFDAADDTIVIETNVLVQAGGFTTSLDFVSNADNFADAQGDVSLPSNVGDGEADIVFQRDLNKLWIDVDDNGILNGQDLQITLNGVTDLSQANFLLVDTITPAAPTGIDLIDADDSGVSNTDDLTNVDPATIRVSFDTAATDGTAALEGDTIILSDDGVTQNYTITAGDIANGYADIAVDLEEGANTLSAQIEDAASNVSGPSVDLVVTLDTTPPTITIDSPVEGDDVVNAAEDGDVVVSGTSNAEAGQTVTVTFDDGVNPVVTATTTVTGAGTWSLAGGNEADISALNNGTITISADVSDAAGNDAPTANDTVVLDNVAPVIAIDSPIEGDDIVNAAEDGDVVVSGTSDAETGQTVTVTFDDGVNPVVTATTTVTGAGTWTLAGGNEADISALNNGTITISADVSDVAGNPATTANDAVVLDNVPPVINIATPIEGDGIVNAAEDNDVLVQGTTDAENGQIVTVTFDDGNNPVVTATATVASGFWTLLGNEADISGLDNGNITISADVSDVAGNDAVTDMEVVVLDNVAPSVVPAVSVSDVTINADDDAGTIVTIAVTYDEAMDPAVNPTIGFTPDVSATLVSQGPGVWSVGNTVYTESFDVTDVDADVDDVDVEVSGGQDVAGNPPAAYTEIDEIDIDMVTPTVVITTNTGTLSESEVGAGTYSVVLTFSEAMNTATTPTITFDPAVASTLTLAGGVWSGGDTVYTATYNVADANVELDDVDITATVAEDLFGNAIASTANADVLDIDTDAPEITSGTAPAATTVAIDENSGAGQTVYTITADDGNPVTFSITGGADFASFSVAGGSGENLVLTPDPDYEAQTSYVVELTATDSFGNTSVQTVTVDINDLNDVAPTVTLDATTATSFTINTIDPDTVGTTSLVTSVDNESAVNSAAGPAGDDTTFNVAQKTTATNTVIEVTDTANLSGPVFTLTQGTSVGDTMGAPASGFGVYYGFGGADNITGGAGDDIIYGGIGDDIITGGDGDDIIDTGAGADTVNLGDDGNADTVVYSVGAGNVVANTGSQDTINGMDTTTDLIQFDGLTYIGARDIAQDALASDGGTIAANEGLLVINNGAIAGGATATAAQIAAALEAAFDFTGVAAGEEFAFSVQTNAGGTQSLFGIFTETNGVDGDAVAGDVQIVGLANLDSPLLDGDNFTL
jgi:Ca2+-binding RTX toxin-like protein